MTPESHTGRRETAGPRRRSGPPDRPVPEDVIRRIVEAGRLTASSMNRQPWHFVVVTERETLGRLGQAVVTGP